MGLLADKNRDPQQKAEEGRKQGQTATSLTPSLLKDLPVPSYTQPWREAKKATDLVFTVCISQWKDSVIFIFFIVSFGTLFYNHLEKEVIYIENDTMFFL